MEMHEKLKELTDKIQREGLEKANEEATRVINEAKSEAEKITGEARKKAATILEEAKKEAEHLGEKISSDVRLTSRQTLLNLKKEISEMIQTSVLDEPLKAAFDDKEFIKKLLVTLVKNWKSANEEGSLEVLLPKDQLEETEKYFREKESGLMKKGLIIREQPGLERGFEIQPQNGYYKISMTDEAFEAFLKEHFKPKTMEFLFGGKKE